LRKHPPSSAVLRVSNADYKVPGTDITLEKGTNLIVPTYAIHHDPDIYPEPSKYDPDRFAPEEVAKRHPYSFIAFGEGNILSSSLQSSN